MKNLVQTIIGAVLIGTASTMWGFSNDLASLKKTVYFFESAINEIKDNQKAMLDHLFEIRGTKKWWQMLKGTFI